ncbi:MAG: alpha/beta hydrolase [Bacteroidales bacterium]|nr:alpha/beta hydrolase [Bacteroidales bacterium]
MKKTALTLCVLALALTVAAQTPETHAFVKRDSLLFLDVHRPAVARADKACVVSVFGGGFVNGSRDDELQAEIAPLLTERGYTVVCIDYRLGLKDSAMVARNSGLLHMQDLFQFCVDIAVEDCAAAVAWLVGHADDLDIDPEKIILTGSSAGAITVLMTDFCRANGMKQAAALPQGWRPAAVVPYAGALICRRGELAYNTPPAPTMLLHGMKDKVVAYKKLAPVISHNLYGSHRVSKVMSKQGIAHWIVRFPGIGHEVATWLPGSVDLFCAFVDQALAGRVTTLDATMTDSKLVPTKWTTMTIRDLYD